MSQLALLGAASAGLLQRGESFAYEVGSTGWTIACTRHELRWEVRAAFVRDTDKASTIGGQFWDGAAADREIARLRGFLLNPSDEQFWPSRQKP